MCNHAYIITANSNFKVLETSLRMIDDERNDVFVLFDKKARISDNTVKKLQACLEQSKLVVLDEIVINWGGIHKYKQY